MNAYQRMITNYDKAASRCYHEIEKVAAQSSYEWKGDGRYYVDLNVGKEGDVASKIRILVDFRGEYYSSFITSGKPLPIAVESYIRNTIYFTAQEAYDGIMEKISKLKENG